MDATLKYLIKEIAAEFPNFAKFLESVETGETVVKDGAYESIGVDDVSSQQYHEYTRIADNHIAALGEERGRDGGWYWLESHNN